MLSVRKGIFLMSRCHFLSERGAYEVSALFSAIVSSCSRTVVFTPAGYYGYIVQNMVGMGSVGSVKSNACVFQARVMT